MVGHEVPLNVMDFSHHNHLLCNESTLGIFHSDISNHLMKNMIRIKLISESDNNVETFLNRTFPIHTTPEQLSNSTRSFNRYWLCLVSDKMKKTFDLA